MIHSILMFLAPEQPAAQATLTSPPAKTPPAPGVPDSKQQPLRFMASVVGNTIGFGALLAGCWFSLQLMQLLMD